MMADHQLAQEEEKAHDKVGGSTEGGACLTAHYGSGYSKVSCSYRWQSKENARDRHKKWFDGNSERLANNPGAGQPMPASHWRIWYAGLNDILPTHPEDWAVDGPSRSPTDLRKDNRGNVIPNGKNFTNAQWPFWNNAHHMIPKGAFNSLVGKAGKAYQLMRVCLLQAKYNINWKRNMFILPMDKAVGAEVFLPRHLGLIKTSDRFRHADYSDMVEAKLKEIIDDYKQICDQAISDTKPHEMPKAELDKKKLEALSKRCELVIKQFGAVIEGGQIDKMKGASTGL